MGESNAIPRLHHWVPAFFLSGFTSTGGRDGALWVHDMRRKTCSYQTTVLKAARGRDFYSLESGEPDALEKALQTIEDAASPVVEAIRSSRQIPSSKDDVEKLLFFVALMDCRIPALREQMRSFVADVSRQMLAVATSNPEYWNALLDRAAVEGHDVEGLRDIDEVRRVAEQSEIVVHDNDWLKLSALEPAYVVFRTLVDRKWSLVLPSSPDDHFIVSERPVVLTWSEPKSGPYPPGHGLEGTRVWVPLGNEVGLLGEFEWPGTLIDATTEMVAQFNTLVLAHSPGFVYSSREDFLFYDEGEAVRDSALFWSNVLRSAARTDETDSGCV